MVGTPLTHTILFVIAESYTQAGMKLLDGDHWDVHYSLSLELYEMAASLSSVKGDLDTMTHCLAELTNNAKTFEDSLNGSAMLAKLLASSLKQNEAISNCLSILSHLGEHFPSHPELPDVMDELLSLWLTQRQRPIDPGPGGRDLKFLGREICSAHSLSSLTKEELLENA